MGEEMDQAKLVDMVTEELMKRLGMKSGNPAARPFLVVGDPGCCEVPPGVSVEYVRDGAAPEWGDCSGLVVPVLSENQLVLASLGLGYGAESSAIVGALLACVPVYVLTEGVSWRFARRDTPIAAHYESCEERLRSFGAKFVASGELGAALQAGASSDCPAPPANASDARGRRLLTEQDLKEVCRDGGELLVDRGAIITPLGRDWLRFKNVTVRREGEP
ncbi:MAG: hypothetical protein GX181_00315 [Synergistaceae bacterium]|nr:hypothetical protein [Synergistota bacterium]NLM70389.1 hypothetical protein [Synergistaceae bacterium]